MLVKSPMLSRCPHRLSKVASPSLRDASCVASKQRPSAALFLAQRRGYTSDRLTESYSEQLDESISAQNHKQKERQNELSFDNSLTELFGDSPIPSNENSQPRPRRQRLTKIEQDVLSGMLDMIVTPPPAKKSPSRTMNGSQASTSSASSSNAYSSLNNGLFDRLRKVYKNPTQRSPEDVVFDQQKEQIGLCPDDAQLFEWTLREVFGESERFEAAARAVMEANAALPPGTPPQPVPPLQPPTYRRIIPHLMHVFRDQYRQPHLSVSIFRYAQRLSPASFVHGCSTEAYNELLETQWVLRDLAAVRDVLQEMHRHAVPLSAKTDGLVDRIRRELGKQQHQQLDEAAGPTEQMRIFAEIEAEIARVHKTREEQGREKDSGRWGAWKRQMMDDMEGGFNNWSSLDGREETRARFRERMAANNASNQARNTGSYDRPSERYGRGRPPFSGPPRERTGVRYRSPFDLQPDDARDRQPMNRRYGQPSGSRDRMSFEPRQKQTYGRPPRQQSQDSSRYSLRQEQSDPSPQRSDRSSNSSLMNEALDALL